MKSNKDTLLLGIHVVYVLGTHKCLGLHAVYVLGTPKCLYNMLQTCYKM